MKAGEYLGQDGNRYRWCHHNGRYIVEKLGYQGVDRWEMWPPAAIAPGDVDAAKAALDALIEEEKPNWVMFKVHRDYSFRIRENGEEPQIREHYRGEDSGWQPVNEHDHWVKAYRKGREVALAGVQELVEAIERTDEWSNGMTAGFRELRDLAKKVKL